jgi:F0F1-type ATP synthase epsilon subunit
MHLEILTPDKKVFAGDADELFVREPAGPLRF